MMATDRVAFDELAKLVYGLASEIGGVSRFEEIDIEWGNLCYIRQRAALIEAAIRAYIARYGVPEEYAQMETEESVRRALEPIRTLLYDCEPETDEEVDAFLRSAGVDPKQVAADGRAFVDKLLSEQNVLDGEQADYCAKEEARP